MGDYLSRREAQFAGLPTQSLPCIVSARFPIHPEASRGVLYYKCRCVRPLFEQTAEVVYEAASDGKDQLRYVAGADAKATTRWAVWGCWSGASVLLGGHESMVTEPGMAWASRPNPAPPESPQRATISGVIGSRLREAVIRKYTMGVSRQVE